MKNRISQTLSALHTPARLKALLVDIFMLYTPLLYVSAYVILGSAQSFRTHQGVIFACVGVYGCLSALFVAFSGQTPGWRYAGLKLVDSKSGGKVGFWRAWARFGLWLVVASTLVGLFIPFFTRDKRLLHDVLSGTTLKSL
ncbi:RDD family protein [Helicobacter salomonis]|uniref:RDD family protein n=1 Tax=Helicobacter salomonis TaxID=56878 RepID=UPI000CF11732|nr:RDD family protein [Helicobacter salomonis]